MNSRIIRINRTPKEGTGIFVHTDMDILYKKQHNVDSFLLRKGLQLEVIYSTTPYVKVGDSHKVHLNKVIEITSAAVEFY